MVITVSKARGYIFKPKYWPKRPKLWIAENERKLLLKRYKILRFGSGPYTSYRATYYYMESLLNYASGFDDWPFAYDRIEELLDELIPKLKKEGVEIKIGNHAGGFRQVAKAIVKDVEKIFLKIEVMEALENEVKPIGSSRQRWKERKKRKWENKERRIRQKRLSR